MKRISLKLVYKTMLLSCLITTFSCKKMLEENPKTVVDVSNAYQNVYDANAAVIGIYGSLMRVADKYIVLNELRADLMSPTVNADQYLRQLNEHSVTTDNPWADPKPWYGIIMNCNDALYHFDIMLKQNKMRPDEYTQRYTDVGAVRCWAYLQLGIQFGSVPYITDPLSTIDDLKDSKKYPKISFDALLKNLIAFMSASTDRWQTNYYGYSSTNTATLSSPNTTVDGYPLNLAFINKAELLADLYLWHGEYHNAAITYRYVSDAGVRGGNDSFRFDEYKVGRDGNNLKDIAYSNNKLNDSNTSGWRSIFGSPTQTTSMNQEWIWTLPFDKAFLPVNPFVDLFSNQGGKYLLTTSQLALDNWNSQLQSNGIPRDDRSTISVRTINGQPVIAKQLYYYLDGSSLLPINAAQKVGRWLIWRGATCLLHFAEAAVNDGQVKVAFALTNVGIATVFNGSYPAAVPSGVNVANFQQTFLDAPYNMDARVDAHGDWYREYGTRSRAGLVNLDPALINNQIGMEDAIINEEGLELAFEGDRWGELMRVALRRGDPALLADRVYQKLLRDHNPNADAVHAKLMNPDNWYLPFKL